MAGGIWEAIGNALLAGGQTAGRAAEEDRQMKLREQERLDRLQQEAQQNAFRQRQMAGADTDRNFRILQAAIEGVPPGGDVPDDVYNKAKAFGLQGRFGTRTAPDAFPLQKSPIIGESIDALKNPMGGTVSHFRIATPQEQLEGAKANIGVQAANDFAGGANAAGPQSNASSTGPIDPTQRKRAAASIAFGPGVAKEMYPDDPAAIPWPSPQPGATGEDALKNVPPGVAAVVRDIANYRYRLPSMGSALKDPYYKGLLQLAVQYKPDFQAQNYEKIQKGLQSFSSGRQGDMIASANKIINHLSDVNDAAQALHNRQGFPGATVWNSVANAYENSKGNDEPLAKFNSSVNAVADEMSKFFSNRAATNDERNHWAQVFNSSQGYDANKAAIGQALQLLQGQLDPLRSQFENATGVKSQWQFLSPETRATLAKMGYDPNALDPGQPGGPFAKAEAGPQVDAEAGSKSLPNATVTLADAAKAAPQSATKVASKAEVEAFAKAKGIKPVDAANRLKAQGYTISAQ